MLETIGNFIQFCNEENQKKLKNSIFLGVVKTMFDALKIPAIACMIRALIRGKVETQDILLSFGIMLLSTIGSGLVQSKSMLLQTEAGYDGCAKKRIEIAEHMRYMPMGYFNKKSLGQIISVTTNGMETLESVAVRVVMMVCEGLLTTSLIIVMLFFFDWRIALVLLFGFLLFLYGNRILQKSSKKISNQKVNADEKLVEKVLEYLQGMAEVKAYHLTGKKCGELNDAIQRNVEINTDMEMTLIPMMTLQSLIAKLMGVVIIVLVCIFYCEGTMSALNAITMVIAAFIIYTSLETAGNYSALIRVIDIYVQRAQEILDTPQMNIVGPSGGGKTTLINLLARFWDVHRGKITLGGVDVKDYDMDALMKNFSFVFQNVVLFHDTIANNIRFGRPEALMEEVICVAKKACCHDFIMSLPKGYETVIGEGGASLSGGEKQRISIARAMMKDAPVIFLDEATANVDPENENELMRAIQELTKNKTVIIIAHRLKTVKYADQILVVENGKIVQCGTHTQLMKEEGLYKKFIGERREAASWRVKST